MNEQVLYDPYPNFRDLGGFEDRSGKQARTGVFYRSGAPAQCGEEESAFLREKGIRTVLDFRIDEERSKQGWSESGRLGVDYVRIPYYDRNGVALIREMEARGQMDWPAVYELVLRDGQEWIRRVFTALAVSEEAVLFHCASGKDRTGVIAALLLELAGAGDLWILTDYALTWYDLPHDGSSFYQTSPSTMQHFLSRLREEYGGADAFLRRTGVPENLLSRIIRRFQG